MKYSERNVFYQIVHSNRYAKVRLIVSDTVVVIRDLYPKSKHHYLLLSKRSQIHVLEDLDVVQDMFKIARRLWQLYSRAGLASGYRIQFNGLPTGGQEIPHLHMHLMLF